MKHEFYKGCIMNYSIQVCFNESYIWYVNISTRYLDLWMKNKHFKCFDISKLEYLSMNVWIIW